MTMITPSYLGETIEYSSLHACRSTLEDPTLIAGRLWGMCAHYLPALAVLTLCWNADRLLNEKSFLTNPYSVVIPNPLAFVALMVVGLYLSLWRLNFLVLWLLAWAAAFLAPAIAAVELRQFQGTNTITIILLTSAFQVTLAAACWFFLWRNVKQRRFLNAEVIRTAT